MNKYYWPLMNHLPDNQVKNIVTTRVLNMDKRSCENLLQAILDEKKHDHDKRTIQQDSRQEERNKLKKSHNDRLLLAERIGVKMVQKSPQTSKFTDLSRAMNTTGLGEGDMTFNNSPRKDTSID